MVAVQRRDIKQGIMIHFTTHWQYRVVANLGKYLYNLFRLVTIQSQFLITILSGCLQNQKIPCFLFVLNGEYPFPVVKFRKFVIHHLLLSTLRISRAISHRFGTLVPRSLKNSTRACRKLYGVIRQ